MIRIFYILIIFLTFSPRLLSQNDSINTNYLNRTDSIVKKLITGINGDSLNLDTSIYKISKDAIDEDLTWGAKYNQLLDIDSSIIILRDGAFVNYGDISLTGGYIEFDQHTSEVLAMPLQDTSAVNLQIPVYKDKSDEFKAKKIRYNLKTKKAWVEFATKKEGELTIHGNYGKYISKESDTITHSDKMFTSGGLITTCNHDNPHWGIKASKIKLIPQKLAVFGFSTVEVGGVPIYPLSLPFGMYPIFQGQKSGLILPRNIDRNSDYGVGFKDIGIYLVLSDYMDLKVTGDIYTRGSHGIHINTNYNKRYKYSGNVSLNYINYFKESETSSKITKSPSFGIIWSHRLDQKSNPQFTSLGGTINLNFGNFQKEADKSSYSQTNNIINSNFNMAKRFGNSPFSMSMGINHNQNTSTRAFNITLPTLNITMSTFYPFKRKITKGKEKWYEKISLSYSSNAQNTLQATDTTILKKSAWKKLETGIKQQASTAAQFRVFKYINLSFGLGYDENHFFKKLEKTFDPTTFQDSIGTDANGDIIYRTTYGKVITDTLNEWNVFRTYTPTINLTTNQYKKILFKKGFIRGIKHKVTWNISASGNPVDQYRIYTDSVATDSRSQYNKYQSYNVLGISNSFGSAYLRKKDISISYGMNNTLEGKYFSKKDTTLKKFYILKGLNFNGTYNVFADSLNFSPISYGVSFQLFKNALLVSYRGVLDVYEEVNNNRIQKYVWEDRQFPFRHESSDISISLREQSIGDFIKMFSKKKVIEKTKSSTTSIKEDDKLISILKDFKLNYNLSMRLEHNVHNVDTFYVKVNSISVNGVIPLTKSWRIIVGNFDYDFLKHTFSYPDFGFERDLHCWRMAFSWYPKGGSYTFFIGVKTSVLNFIKYNHGSDPLRANLNNISF